MTAKEALQITNMSYIYEAIRTYAEKGESSINIHVDIPRRDIGKLMENGYVVTSVPGISPEYCISWEHADKK